MTIESVIPKLQVYQEFSISFFDKLCGTSAFFWLEPLLYVVGEKLPPYIKIHLIFFLLATAMLFFQHVD